LCFYKVPNRGLELLEEDEQNITYSKFEIDSEIRKYYKSCINDGSVNTGLFDSLKQTLSKLGGWPVLEGDRWKETNSSFQWYDMVLEMEAMGFYKHSMSIISYYIGYDLQNQGKKMLHLNMPLGDLPWVEQNETNTTIQNTTWTNTKWEHISDVLLPRDFGANIDTSRRDMNETRMLALEIWEVMLNATTYRTPYRPLAFMIDNKILDDKSIKIKASRIDTTLGNITFSLTNNASTNLTGHPPSWTTFMAKWLSRQNVTINDDMPIVLKDFQYLVEISRVLSKYQKKPRVLANYLLLILVLEEM
jgi:hypothetical protein